MSFSLQLLRIPQNSTRNSRITVIYFLQWMQNLKFYKGKLSPGKFRRWILDAQFGLIQGFGLKWSKRRKSLSWKVPQTEISCQIWQIEVVLCQFDTLLTAGRSLFVILTACAVSTSQSGSLLMKTILKWILKSVST